MTILKISQMKATSCEYYQLLAVLVLHSAGFEHEHSTWIGAAQDLREVWCMRAYNIIQWQFQKPAPSRKGCAMQKGHQNIHYTHMHVYISISRSLIIYISKSISISVCLCLCVCACVIRSMSGWLSFSTSLSLSLSFCIFVEYIIIHVIYIYINVNK